MVGCKLAKMIGPNVVPRKALARTWKRVPSQKLETDERSTHCVDRHGSWSRTTSNILLFIMLLSGARVRGFASSMHCDANGPSPTEQKVSEELVVHSYHVQTRRDCMGHARPKFPVTCICITLSFRAGTTGRMGTSFNCRIEIAMPRQRPSLR